MRLIIIAFIAAVLFPSTAAGQTAGVFLNQLTKMLEKQTADQPVEKAYLHFDKPYYAAGDNLWFKAYVTMGNGHRLSTMSNVLNVVLQDEQKTIVKSLKVMLKNGNGWGDMALPENMRAGVYRITAYTNWMRNAGAELFFTKDVLIGNSITAQQPVKKVPHNVSATAKPDMQFFPEGGNLVNGLASKMAFKAVGTNGLGIPIKGIITDNAGTQITQFTSVYAGMGVFDLTPGAGKNYTATVTYPDGSMGQVALPKALDKGYVLHVDNSNTPDIMVSISTNADTRKQDENKELSLLAQANNQVYFATTFKADETAAVFNIPRSNFLTGIVQFTLFADGLPVNQRLAFIQTADQLKLDVGSDQTIYTTRNKTRGYLSVKDAAGLPVQGSFSVAVVDEGKVNVDEADETTILSSLLLTADLKGFVEQPNYYFTNVNDKTNAGLDALMLTQGYRNFEWKPILSDKLSSPVYQPEKSLSITGRVVTGKGKPVANGKVTLLIKSSGDAIDTLTDNSGRFAFNDLEFPDSTNFVIQARTATNSDKVTVRIDHEPYLNILLANTGTSSAEAMMTGSLFSTYLLHSKSNYDQDVKYGLNGRGRMLNQVDIKSQKINKALIYSANLNGPGNADQVILGDELINNGDKLSQILQNRLTGVIFQVDKPVAVGNSYAKIDANAPLTRGLLPMEPMVVVLDGMMQDYTVLDKISPYNVASIEVLRSSAYLSIYGSRAGVGALIITTKHGSGGTSYDTKAPGMVSYMPVGYYQSRAFYSPRYDAPQGNSQIADLRSTIFWHPNINTNKEGMAAFDYFNSDSKGTCKIIVEGIDTNGHIGRQVYRYKVE